MKLAHRVSIRDFEDRVTTPVLSASSLALAFAPIFFLFWLMQPKVLANPGVSALRVAGAASYEPFLQDTEPHNRQISRAASRRRASHNLIRNTARPRYQRGTRPNASRLTA